jgi:hypothetical protein
VWAAYVVGGPRLGVNDSARPVDGPDCLHKGMRQNRLIELATPTSSSVPYAHTSRNTILAEILYGDLSVSLSLTAVSRCSKTFVMESRLGRLCLLSACANYEEERE